MSIVYTADVFCDGEDCSLWTNGVSASKPPTKAQARAEHSVRKGWIHVGGKDFCPTCVRNGKVQSNERPA